MADVKFTFKKKYYDNNGGSCHVVDWSDLARLSSRTAPPNYRGFSFKTDCSIECRAFGHTTDSSNEKKCIGRKPKSSAKQTVASEPETKHHSKANEKPVVSGDKGQRSEKMVIAERPEEVQEVIGSDKSTGKSISHSKKDNNEFGNKESKPNRQLKIHLESSKEEPLPRKRLGQDDDDSTNRNNKSRKMNQGDIPGTSDDANGGNSMQQRLQDLEDRVDCVEEDSNQQFQKIRHEQQEMRHVQREQQQDIEEIRKEQEAQRKILEQWIQHIPKRVEKIDGLMERSPDYQLEDNCLEAGLRFNGDTPSDGNGLFHAISNQLDLLRKPKQSASELRADVVNFLRENPIVQGPSGTIDFKSTQMDWEDYLNTVSEDGVWADNVVLQALACYLKTDIFIVTSWAHGDDEPVYQRAPGGGGIPIRIGHVNGCHYRSLVVANSSENLPYKRSSKDSKAADLLLPTVSKGRVSVSSKIQQLISKQDECTTILKGSDSAELTKILQHFLQISDADISDIDVLSKEEKARRIYGHLAGPVNGVEVDLKSNDSSGIASGLLRIARAWKDQIGFDQFEAAKLAEAVIQSGDILNWQDLSKLYNGPAQKAVTKAFKEYQFNIGWQTQDGFPLLRSTDLGTDENNVQIMKRIYYTVIRKPSESYWGNRVKNYKKKLLDSLDKLYKEGDPKLPEWFEDGNKSNLERQCSEARGQKLRIHDIVKPISKCSNITYLWAVYFGDKFSSRHKCRSYAGVATGVNLCRDRWGQHFRAALQLIKLLLKCDIVPRKTPDWILHVDLVLALVIVDGFDMYKSALYCVGVFTKPKDAQDHEKRIIEQLKLTQIDRGLNRRV